MARSNKIGKIQSTDLGLVVCLDHQSPNLIVEVMPAQLHYSKSPHGRSILFNGWPAHDPWLLASPHVFGEPVALFPSNWPVDACTWQAAASRKPPVALFTANQPADACTWHAAVSRRRPPVALFLPSQSLTGRCMYLVGCPCMYLVGR